MYKKQLEFKASRQCRWILLRHAFHHALKVCNFLNMLTFFPKILFVNNLSKPSLRKVEKDDARVCARTHICTEAFTWIATTM